MKFEAVAWVRSGNLSVTHLKDRGAIRTMCGTLIPTTPQVDEWREIGRGACGQCLEVLRAALPRAYRMDLELKVETKPTVGNLRRRIRT